MKEKVIIFSAPSGSGKSTVVNHLLEVFKGVFEFSVSATSRAPRGQEQDGREYYFITPDEFRSRIAADEFVEHEEVYNGVFYGTLKSEVRRIWSNGHVILFDVDVKGGVSLKKYFGEKALSVFVQAPSVEELRRRLVARGTDSPEFIEERVAKASEEMTYAPKFDYVLVNDDLDTCLAEADGLVSDFLDDKGMFESRGRCKAALFFGSFNPIHQGHRAILDFLCSHTEADEVRLVVTPKNPFGKRDLADARQRLESAREAIGRTGLNVEVSDVEFDLPEPLYTVNTLEHLDAVEPEVEHILVIGGDNLGCFEKWHRASDILAGWRVWVYPREGFDCTSLRDALYEKYSPKEIRILEAELYNISSTMIREGEKAGADMSSFRI